MTDLTAYFLQSGFTTQEAAAVAALFRPKTMGKGDHFLEEGKTARYLAFIHKGLFQFYFLKDGHEHTTYVVGVHNFLASLSSFISQTPAKENIRALTDAEIWQIHFDDLQQLKTSHQKFKTFYIGVLEHLLICIDDSRHKLIALTAEERYAALLNEEPELLKQIPLQYLASILGVTPRHLSRIRNNIR